MDWKQQAKLIFNVPKPAHFADYRHCCECAEHDQTLLAFDVDSIGLAQLGNPGWDPLCFSSAEGLMYYLPALIRLTLDTMENPRETYLDQMLFHLIYDGPGNRLFSACSTEQREFVADFLKFLVERYSSQIDAQAFTSDDILRAHEIWRAPLANKTIQVTLKFLFEGGSENDCSMEQRRRCGTHSSKG